MKKQLRKNWTMGFLGIFSLFGFLYFQNGNWLYLVYLGALVYMVYPNKARMIIVLIVRKIFINENYAN